VRPCEYFLITLDSVARLNRVNGALIDLRQYVIVLAWKVRLNLLHGDRLDVLKLLSCSGIGALSACSLALDGTLLLKGLTLSDLIDLRDSLFHTLCVVRELPRLIELASCLLLEMRLVDVGLFCLLGFLLFICGLCLAEISE